MSRVQTLWDSARQVNAACRHVFVDGKPLTEGA